MITEFDFIFHENGFIFVNEMKKHVEAQMAGRVEGQRNASKFGHEWGKGNLRQTRKGSLVPGIPGYKAGGADARNQAIHHDTGRPKNLSKQYHDEVEATRQKNREKRKNVASTVGQDNLNRALGEKKKEKQAVNASALMESIELI